MASKTYLVELKNGKVQKITVPDDWKVTFGALNPGSKSENRMGFRVYETKEKQRLCIVDVMGFRDMDIGVEEKTVSRQRKTATMQDNGQAKDFVVEQVVEEWVNPDAPRKQSPIALPSLGVQTDGDDEPEEDGVFGSSVI